MPDFRTRIRNLASSYGPLIKSLQTFLLISTGLASYMSARCPVFNLPSILGLTGSLFLAVSGSTVLNMWYDRDIDARMERTCWRPLPVRRITPRAALYFGLVLSVLGVSWALLMDLLYGAVVFAGLFFDVVVYTLWLKRRTCWSIVWGGISGAMPVLAGRVLGLGAIDWIGITLALGVLFWIPTHILTFSIRYQDDYRAAGIPTFPATYNIRLTRAIIALSSVLASLAMLAASIGIGMAWNYLSVLGLLSFALFVMAVVSYVRPSQRVNFGLFKYASMFMLGAMIMIVLETI
jgi:protoheme IX farnesyltransferase